MEPRLRDWESRFQTALQILDAAAEIVGDFKWSFGGGTALMLKFHHRHSKDIDIFLGDPQYLGHVTPRLSPTAEQISGDYDEGAEYVKIRLPDGEIDFIGTGWLTDKPFELDEVMGRLVNVETPAEIIGKKIHHRADTFKARDLYDLATVFDQDRPAIHSVAPILRAKRRELLDRIKGHRIALQEEFDALDLFESTITLDECIETLHRSFKL